MGANFIASLALGYLSSYLKAHGHEILIIDGLRDNLSHLEILNILQENKIKAAGLTCMSANYDDIVALSKYLKENGITVIIGGIHPTFLPYQTLVDSNADYVCCGEGERALLEFLNNNMSNKRGGGGGLKVYTPTTTCRARLRRLKRRILSRTLTSSRFQIGNNWTRRPENTVHSP
jgi:radical SAM superfamily enzyme YgiQ (UPF0313 family)